MHLSCCVRPWITDACCSRAPLLEAAGHNPQWDDCTANLARANPSWLKIRLACQTWRKLSNWQAKTQLVSLFRLAGSATRHANTVHGMVNAVTTHVKLWDFAAGSLLNAQDSKWTRGVFVLNISITEQSSQNTAPSFASPIQFAGFDESSRLRHCETESGEGWLDRWEI